jgi:hypothetical protein
VELQPPDGDKRAWDIYAVDVVSFEDTIRALNGLAGERASGDVRVLSGDGKPLLAFRRQ